jgi:hypothetical protein
MIHAKKRGEGSTSDIYLTIAYLVLFGMLFLISYKYIGSVTFGKEFERTYIARDTALLVATLQASPGEIEYTYPVNLSQLKIKVRAMRGNVSAEETPELASTYYFPMAEGLSQGEYVFDEKIHFRKDNAGIYEK